MIPILTGLCMMNTSEYLLRLILFVGIWNLMPMLHHVMEMEVSIDTSGFAREIENCRIGLRNI